MTEPKEPREPIQASQPTIDDRARWVVETIRNNRLTDREKRDIVYEIICHQEPTDTD
jgi:hypothetical protein